MMKEIYNRGPISCGIDADPLRTYTSGVIATKGEMVDHVISVVGWGTDPEHGKYWRVRNSWGEYWGELGYVRVKFGALLVEDQCAWAKVGAFTTAETGVHCYEDGGNCAADPSPGPRPPRPRPGPARAAATRSRSARRAPSSTRTRSAGSWQKIAWRRAVVAARIPPASATPGPLGIRPSSCEG